MKYKWNNKEYEIKSWLIFLCVFLLLFGIGKCSMKQNANGTKTYEQQDRTETYYHDENGNVIRKETSYKDGRPTEVVEYE